VNLCESERERERDRKREREREREEKEKQRERERIPIDVQCQLQLATVSLEGVFVKHTNLWNLEQVLRSVVLGLPIVALFQEFSLLFRQ
jgi:hypothetical protein